MKINEVIIEAVNQSTGTPNAEPQQAQPAPKKPGLWSKIRSKLSGQGQSNQQQIAQGIGAQANQLRIRSELNRFNQFLSQITSGKEVTPELLQLATKKFISRRYPGVDQSVLDQLSKVSSVDTANQLVAQGYNSMMANITDGDDEEEAQRPATRVQTPPAQTPGGIEVPFSAGAGPRKTEPAASPEQQAQQQAMAQGISVISHEPIILRNKAGKEFGLNDKGQWIHLSSGKIPAEAYQAFLSQQHDISLGLK